MQIIKYIILILIFGISTYIGILMSKRYSSREIELKEFKKLLIAIKSKIKFTYEPIADIFDDVSKNTINSISNILKNTNENMKTMAVDNAWNKAIEENSLNINKEDKNIIKGFSKMLRQN